VSTGISIGVVVTEHIALGVVSGSHEVSEMRTLAGSASPAGALAGMPVEELTVLLATEIASLAGGRPLEAIGLAFPGIIREGVIEDSPNLQQLKGYPVAAAICAALAERGIETRLAVSNDADVVAAGVAARHGLLDRLVRVWTLGTGIGFGHYPVADGVWEGGHIVVTLDPAERFCGCGGRGHLEGIMGHRAMRLRFLDLEPEEVFALAKAGPDPDSIPDPRCTEFVLLWHRALAAATATSIHLEGGGRFYITGLNARFVNLGLLNRCVQEMVKMSPLQSYVIEVVERSDELAVLGAAVNAARS
jgi:glucokinase